MRTSGQMTLSHRGRGARMLPGKLRMLFTFGGARGRKVWGGACDSAPQSAC